MVLSYVNICAGMSGDDANRMIPRYLGGEMNFHQERR